MNTARICVPEQVAVELAAGQSYFRDHLAHAHIRIAELEATTRRLEDDTRAQHNRLGNYEDKIRSMKRERQETIRDLAWYLRWQQLKQCGVDVWDETHGHGATLDRAREHVDAMASLGEVALREEHYWQQTKEVVRP